MLHHIDCFRSISHIVLLSVSESLGAGCHCNSVYIFIDEAGFNLAKRRGQGQNIICHRAIVNVPGKRGGNIIPSIYAAISQKVIYSIAIPTLVSTTPPVSSHSWTHHMASSFQPRRGVDQSRPAMLSFRT